MAITGAHVLVYTTEPEKVRDVFRDVFGFSHVDAGDGWLIFALPPAELGVHPASSAEPGHQPHELSLMCDDIEATMTELRAKGLEFTGEPENQGWGIVTGVLLPGGLRVQLYQPLHKTAI